MSPKIKIAHVKVVIDSMYSFFHPGDAPRVFQSFVQAAAAPSWDAPVVLRCRQLIPVWKSDLMQVSKALPVPEDMKVQTHAQVSSYNRYAKFFSAYVESDRLEMKHPDTGLAIRVPEANFNIKHLDTVIQMLRSLQQAARQYPTSVEARGGALQSDHLVESQVDSHLDSQLESQANTAMQAVRLCSKRAGSYDHVIQSTLKPSCRESQLTLPYTTGDVGGHEQAAAHPQLPTSVSLDMTEARQSARRWLRKYMVGFRVTDARAVVFLERNAAGLPQVLTGHVTDFVPLPDMVDVETVLQRPVPTNRTLTAFHELAMQAMKGPDPEQL